MKILLAGFLVLISAVGVSAQTVACYYTDSTLALKFEIDTNSRTQNYQFSGNGGMYPFKGKWEGGTFYGKEGDRRHVAQLLITPDQIKLDQQIKIGNSAEKRAEMEREGLNKNSIGHFLYTVDRRAGTFTMVYSVYQNGQDTHKEARSGTCR